MNGILGGILLLLGGGLLGWGMTCQLGRRIEAVIAIQEGLYAMERELTLQLTPLPMLLQQEGLPFSQVFSRCGIKILGGESARQSWLNLVEELPHLGREERDLLRPLGDVLGKYEGEVQSVALLRVACDLRSVEDRLRQDRSRLGRLYPTVGLTVGAFLGIFLG